MAENFALNTHLHTREPRQLGSSRQRDVLLVCANKLRRAELAQMFELRGLSVVRCFDSRTGISEARGIELRAVILVPDQQDRNVSALVRFLRNTHRQAAVWLIGNPLLLNLAELVHRAEVAVLPAEIRTAELEAQLFALQQMPKAEELPVNGKKVMRARWAQPLEFKENFLEARAEFEQRFIARALRLNDGNVSATAKAIGMARRNLQFKIRTLGIDIEGSRSNTPENEPCE